MIINNKTSLSRVYSLRRPGALGLRSRIALSVLAVVILVFSSVIAYVAYSSSGRARLDAEALTLSTVREVGNRVVSIMDENISVLYSIASTVEHIDRDNPASRKVVSDIIKANMTQTREIISLWIAFEPNAFDNRDAEFAKSGGYDKTGQFMVGFLNNDGKVERVYDVTSDFINEPGAGDFYQIPLKTGKHIIGPPETYTYPNGKSFFMTTISIPVKIDGKIVGVVGMDFNFSTMQKLVGGTRAISEGATFSIISSEGIIIQGPDSKMIGSNMAEIQKGKPTGPAIMSAIYEGKLYHDVAISVLTKQSAIRIFSPVQTKIEGITMTVNAVVPEKEVLAGATEMTRNTIIAAFIGIVLLVAVVLLISSTVVRPIVGMSQIMERAALLDFTADPSLAALMRHKDEIGGMARAYSSLKDSISSMLGSLDSQARSFSNTAQNLAAISEESVASMEEIKASVDEVTSLSGDNISSLEQANRGVEEVSQASAATASSAEDGAAIAGRTADLTRQAFKEVDVVVSSIRSAGERSLDSGRSIQKVNDSVGAITSFVSTITGIADQTNLLALNAAIEAARAGEAGRGFAVVAEEVRKLAEESGRAAQEVQKLISALQSDSGSASSVIEDMRKLLVETVDKAGHAQEDLNRSLGEVDKLSGHMQTIASAAQEQAASSSEMAESVNAVASSINEIGTALGHIQSATAETAYASENVAKEAQDMTGGVEKLEELLAQFKYDRISSDSPRLAPGTKVGGVASH